MSLRTLLVPMVGDDADRHALALAGRIAMRHRSHVTALFAEPDSRDIPMAMVGDATGGYLSRDLVRTLEERVDTRRAKAESIFAAWRVEAAIGASDTPGDDAATAQFVREIGTDAVLVRAHGLVTDLVVTVQPDPAEAERAVFFESALFEAGKPVILVPKGGASLPPEDAPVQIAWRPAAVSARALTAALPFLARAREVIVSQAVKADETPAIESVVEYLAWHGIRARGVIHPGPRDPVRLLQEVTRNGAGMLVLGAYVNSRAHALVFGGVTRHIVEKAHLPVLFAH